MNFLFQMFDVIVLNITEYDDSLNWMKLADRSRGIGKESRKGRIGV